MAASARQWVWVFGVAGTNCEKIVKIVIKNSEGRSGRQHKNDYCFQIAAVPARGTKSGRGEITGRC
jgi:hypothetical protein